MDKLKQWVALTVVAALAIGAGGWFLLISPKKDEAADLNAQADATTAQNAVLRNELALLKEQAKDLPQQRANLESVAVKLPDNPQLPSYIRSLTDITDKAGVTFVSLEPGPPVVDAAAANSAGTLNRIPVTIVVNGGFFETRQLLRLAEDLPRAQRVTNLTITSQEQEGDFFTETTLVGEIYMRTAPPAATTIAAGTAGTSTAATASGPATEES